MKVALIFDKSCFHTTGVYIERAFSQLGVPYDHWWLRDAEHIPASYDVYLRIDQGDSYSISLPTRLCPVVFYAIDTHLPSCWKQIRRLARAADVVLCVHRDGASLLPGARWLPVACDPQLHSAPNEPMKWDLAFVGHDGGLPRKLYLQALRERYPHSYLGTAAHTELGKIYGRARIGFNYAIANDVNMRVFEVLAAGTLLLTNQLPHNDLERLGLVDGQHLVLYRSPEELFALIDHYLTHPTERCRIAEVGQRLVQAQHTYRHRAVDLLEHMATKLELPELRVGESHAKQAGEGSGVLMPTALRIQDS